VAALGGDAAVEDHADLVGVDDRGEAVRHDEGDPVSQEAFQRPLHGQIREPRGGVGG
jgi:hypothetical protein